MCPVQRCLLQEQSIQRRQMVWGIARLAESDAAIEQLKQDVDAIKKPRDFLNAKWSGIAFIVLSIVFPIIGLTGSRPPRVLCAGRPCRGPATPPTSAACS